MIGNLTVKTLCKTLMPKKCTYALSIDQSRSKSIEKCSVFIIFECSHDLLLHVPCLEQILAIMSLQSHLFSVCLRRSHLLPVFDNHEFRLPTNVILCRPLLRFPSIVPVRARCSKPLSRHMCPRNSNCLFLIVLISDLSVLISLRIDSFDLFSVHDILISAASSFFFFSLLIVQHSHPYRRIDHTYVFKTLIFEVILIFLLVSIVLIF